MTQLTPSDPPTPDNPWSPPPAAGEVLEIGSVLPVAAPRRRRTGLVVGLAVGGVLLAGAAGAATYVATALGGGGEQPEQHLPGTAVAFAKVDLDPAANQKIDAIRFLRKLPRSRTCPRRRRPAPLRLRVPRRAGRPGAPSWDDVEPWLGQRLGVAVLPTVTDGRADVVVAVQVTDEGAARTTLADGGDGWGAVVADGWAVLAPTAEQAQQAVDDADGAALADDADFVADGKALGEDGVAAVWSDLEGLASVAKETSTLGNTFGVASAGLQGRVSAALRFDGPLLELAGRATGAGGESIGTGTSGVADLPAGTVAAAGFAVAPGTIEKLWTQSLAPLATGFGGVDEPAIEEALGVSLRRTSWPCSGTASRWPSGGTDTDAPVVGVRGRSTADTQAGRSALVDIAGFSGLALESRDADGGWVLATTPDYADSLAAGGDLGAQDAVRGVVPDVDTAQLAAYVDLAVLAERAEQDGDAETAKTLKALTAFGLSATRDGDGLRFSARLGG